MGKGRISRLLGAAAGALLLASCSSESFPATPPALVHPTSLPPTVVGLSISKLRVEPWPEGSVVESQEHGPPGWTSPYYGERFLAAVTALGTPLPMPLPQPKHCKDGTVTRTVVLELDDHTEIAYGPCTRPKQVEKALAALFDDPPRD